VAAAVKRSVWMRDGGQCSFVASGGHRGEARGFLEFHHLRPYAATVVGPPTTQGLM